LKKTEICKILKDRKYDPDPIVKWKERISREDGHESNDLETNQDENESESIDKKDYDYLLGMPIWNLTLENNKKQKAKNWHV
jgi:hypothetical protein